MNNSLIYSHLPKIVSLFSGAGGLDLGFKQNGFEISLAIDYEQAAIETHRLNFETTKSIVADLTKLGPIGVVDYVKQKIQPGEKIGIIGGPPCQGFSRANPTSDVDDPRNSLPSLYVDIIRELQKYWDIEFVIFENVLGMKDRKHEKKYKGLLDGLHRIGFEIQENHLCAYDYGVPQKRQRIIIIAFRANRGYSSANILKQDGIRTVREAIGELKEPAFYSKKLKLEDIPEHPNHWTMQPKSKKFSEQYIQDSASRSFRKLNWDRASPTIAFGNREIHVHPNGRRRLSIFEALLLQGFPRTFVLKGNLTQQVHQISNAVPPPMAKSIAAAVKESLIVKKWKIGV